MGLLGPNIPPIVDFLAIGETALAAILVASFLLARMHKGRIHHYVMIGAFSVDLLLFKPVMFYRAMDGSNGFFPWNGTHVLIHFIAAMTVAALGLAAIYLGFRRVIRREKKMFLPPKGKKHRLVGYAFLVAWFLSYIIGILIYLNNWG